MHRSFSATLVLAALALSNAALVAHASTTSSASYAPVGDFCAGGLPGASLGLTARACVALPHDADAIVIAIDDASDLAVAARYEWYTADLSFIAAGDEFCAETTAEVPSEAAFVHVVLNEGSFACAPYPGLATTGTVTVSRA